MPQVNNNRVRGQVAEVLSMVCDLVFLSRYMRPEGPWQRLRRCLSNGGGCFYIPFFPCARTGLTGHSGPPTPPTVKKDKRKKKSPPQKPPEGKDTMKVHSRAGLGPPPPHSRPPPCPPGALSLYPRTLPLWCAKIPTRRPWPSPPTDTVPTGLVAPSTSKPPRHPSIASSSAVAMPGTS